MSISIYDQLYVFELLVFRKYLLTQILIYSQLHVWNFSFWVCTGEYDPLLLFEGVCVCVTRIAES